MLVNELYSYGRATAIPSCSASTVTEDDSGWMQQCRSTLQKLRTGFAHESCFKSCMLSANLESRDLAEYAHNALREMGRSAVQAPVGNFRPTQEEHE